MVQSCILELGAWLAIGQEITPGIIIAASIIAGRSFALLEVAVTQWQVFLAARKSYHSLGEPLALAHYINCQLKAHQGLGVIGPSGAGKATLLGYRLAR